MFFVTVVSLQAGELRKHSGRGHNSNNIKNSSDIKNSSEDKEELHQPQQQLTNKRKTIRERKVYTTGIEGRRVTSSVLIKNREACHCYIIALLSTSNVRIPSHECRYTLSLRMFLPPQLLSLSTSNVYVHGQYA